MTGPSVELCSVPADFGQGANDGAYYPIGLLTVGSHLQRDVVGASVSVVDLHHQTGFEPQASIVGISASSTLNYRRVLSLAGSAKAAGATVVLGGPHVTKLADQVLRNRRDVVDYVVRGYGEAAMVALVRAIADGTPVASIPGISWRTSAGQPVHNAPSTHRWQYDDYIPLDLSLLSSGVLPYWDVFRQRIDQSVDAAFAVFTHFGCGFRAMMQGRAVAPGRIGSWCSYCSLNDPLLARCGRAILAETLGLLQAAHVPLKANVLLKCYGDNVGTQRSMLQELATAIEESAEWRQYRIGWTFYSQSSRVSPELVSLLRRVGTRHLYIGFDSADNKVQAMNGLGTSRAAHRRAVALCRDAGIRIQAGFVLGCAGETRKSVQQTVRFAEELAEAGVLERINSAILFVIPGSPAYGRLCELEPWIVPLDELPTESLQWHWIRHFCPQLGSNTKEGMQILRWAANRLDELSPGPHASMGFVSERLAAGRSAPEAVCT